MHVNVHKGLSLQEVQTVISALCTLQQQSPIQNSRKCSGRDPIMDLSVNGVLYVLREMLLGKWGKSDSVDCLVHGTWQHGPSVPIVVESPKVADINDEVFLLDSDTKLLFQLHTDINV